MCHVPSLSLHRAVRRCDTSAVAVHGLLGTRKRCLYGVVGSAGISSARLPHAYPSWQLPRCQHQRNSHQRTLYGRVVVPVMLLNIVEYEHQTGLTLVKTHARAYSSIYSKYKEEKANTKTRAANTQLCKPNHRVASSVQSASTTDVITAFAITSSMNRICLKIRCRTRYKPGIKVFGDCETRYGNHAPPRKLNLPMESECAATLSHLAATPVTSSRNGVSSATP